MLDHPYIFTRRLVMDSNTGKLYSQNAAAIEDGIAAADLVSMEGSIEAIISISTAVKKDRRKKNKKARESRKKNRK